MNRVTGLLAALLVAAGIVSGASGSPKSLGLGLRGQAVPILMYHVIARVPPGAPFPQLYVSPRDFAAEVGWLAARGYHAVTLGQVFASWHGRGSLPAKPIVLSFDDGYRGDTATAMPVLQTRHWAGVLNLQVYNLVPARVRALIRAGWEIDAHTFTHPDLTRVGPAQLQHEVAGSRQAIRSLYHVPVNFFCYPAGRYDQNVIAAVRAAGYDAATTTQFGLARPGQNPYELERVRVDGSDGVAGLASKLRSLGA